MYVYKVYVVGHTPPGVDERASGARPLKEHHNRRYLQLVRQYAGIIAGQFFGHWHSDTFRTIYSDMGTFYISEVSLINVYI